MDMSKLSWMLVGLMPLVAVAADGTWETLSFAKGTYAPLDAYTRAGGKLVGAALKGETYPMALRNVTKADVSEQGKLDVVVPAGAWVLHPAPQAAAVLRHAPAKAGPYDVTVTCAALKAGDGNPKTAGVDVTLLVAGAERARFTLRAGTDQVRRTIRLAAATAVSLALARPETVPVDVPGAWTRLPPRDVDPKLSHVSDPIPRPWSGQKAALAFARLGVSPQAASRPLGADGLAFTGAARPPGPNGRSPPSAAIRAACGRAARLPRPRSPSRASTRSGARCASSGTPCRTPRCCCRSRSSWTATPRTASAATCLATTRRRRGRACPVRMV